MSARNNLSRADKQYIGRVTKLGYNSGKPGVEVTPLYVYTIAPTATAANNVAVSQSVTTAFAINGSLASGGVATLDVPRALVGAWTNTAIITVTGTDVYGKVITESSASGTSFTGKKAFKTITGITSNASITGATVGTGKVFGLPFRADTGRLVAWTFNNAADTGTFVAADTSAITATTGDIRGTFAPAGTPDGVKPLTLVIALNDTTTEAGAFGVTA